MFLNQITEGLRDPKDNPCWKGYHPVGTKKKNGRTVPNCVPESQENVKEGAYEDGVSDGIRGTPNRRASSIYGPSTGEYDRGYQVGLQKGKEQQQARLAQAQQDSAPYEKMSDEELIQLRKDIQQRSTERQKIYSKLRGADFSFDPKRHLPANDAELKAQNAKDNKAWHIINQVLQQRGVNINKLGESEGSKFGSIYAEQLAQQTFDIKPNLKDENEVLNLGYSIAVRELGPRARGFFRDEDFPSDFVSAYGWLQDQRQQGVAEGSDNTVAFEIDSENAYNHVMKRFGSVIDWDGDAMVVPRRYWPAVQEVAHNAGGAATEYGTEGMAEASIPYALSAANANAEYRRQGAAGGGYRGRIDIPVQSREDYISAGRALKKAAAAAGQKIEYGLSNGVMSVFSDSMDADTLDQFIDSVLEQDVAEGSEDLRAKLDLYNEKAFEAGHRHDDQAWRKYTKAAKQIADQLGLKYKVTGYGLEIIEQGMAEGFPHDVDHMPGPRIKNPQTGCQRCHGKGYVYKTADGKVLPSNEQGAKRYKCGACGGIGFVKQGVAEGSEDNRPWTNKEEEKLRRSVAGLDSMFGKDDAWTKTKQKQIKQQIKTKPMAGPKGQLPEQGVAEAKADPTSTWVVYDGNKVKRFKTHTGAKAYAEQHGGKVASSAHYADKIQGKQGVAEDLNDTVYPNATVIKSKNGKPVGEIYQDGNEWGCFHYRADRGYDMIDSREDAIQALKDLHSETARHRPDYTIKGVAEGDYDIRRDPTYQKYNPETHTMMYKDGKHKAVKHDQVAKAKSLGWKVRSSLKAFAKGQGGVAEGDRDPGALASRAHIASQERKHQAWDEKQKQLEKEFYANHPELDDRHKSVDNLVKEFSEMLSRTK